MMIEGFVPESKAELAYTLIKNKILFLELVPGQPLREIELSKMFSMSRTPIRVAIERLINEGFAERKGAKTNVVSSVTVDAFMDIYRVRVVLEELCVSLAAYSWQDHSEIEEIRAVVEKQFLLASQMPVDSRAIQETDRTFHRKLAKLSGNRLLYQEIALVYDLYWRYIFYSMHKNYSMKIVQEHKDIIDAIERRDSNLAQSHVRNHLSKVKDEILMGLAKGFDPATELSDVSEGYSIKTTHDEDK